MSSSKKKRMYKILLFAAILLGCLTFTPLVIPYGTHEPGLFFFPYTLWTGLIVAALFVLLTYLVYRIHPGKEEEEL